MKNSNSAQMSLEFIKSQFQKYYRENNIDLPDRFGRRESWWRDRASKWWTRLESATSEHQRITKEIEEAEKVLDEARNDGKRRRYRRKIKSLRKEDEKYKAQIDEARHMLNDVLLDEARIADADPSWLRP